ncbi:hypothetical protein J132_04005 [Termitomyces sp. J132]|nr:hypothetical protein J132_04005 [Termitomyces sp. J132]
MANLGGSNLSSQTMLLGREYYQTCFGERYLVLGPLVAHIIAGSAKRLLSSSSKTSKPRSLTSLLSWTGYSTTLFFLPIHYMTHRIHPTSTLLPICAVGPSELDYEFVKTGLDIWPKTSWFLYTGLLLSVTAHFTDGAILLWNTYLRNTAVVRRSFIRRMSIIVGFSLPILTGLFVLSKEPSMIFPSFAKRFETVFMSSWIYRL